MSVKIERVYMDGQEQKERAEAKRVSDMLRAAGYDFDEYKECALCHKKEAYIHWAGEAYLCSACYSK